MPAKTSKISPKLTREPLHKPVKTAHTKPAVYSSHYHGLSVKTIVAGALITGLGAIQKSVAQSYYDNCCGNNRPDSGWIKTSCFWDLPTGEVRVDCGVDGEVKYVEQTNAIIASAVSGAVTGFVGVVAGAAVTYGFYAYESCRIKKKLQAEKKPIIQIAALSPDVEIVPLLPKKGLSAA